MPDAAAGPHLSLCLHAHAVIYRPSSRDAVDRVMPATGSSGRGHCDGRVDAAAVITEGIPAAGRVHVVSCIPINSTATRPRSGRGPSSGTVTRPRSGRGPSTGGLRKSKQRKHQQPTARAQAADRTWRSVRRGGG